MYAPTAFSIQSGAQVVDNTQIYFELSSRNFLELYSPLEKTNLELHLYPDIIDFTHTSSVQTLLANLTYSPIK